MGRIYFPGPASWGDFLKRTKERATTPIAPRMPNFPVPEPSSPGGRRTGPYNRWLPSRPAPITPRNLAGEGAKLGNVGVGTFNNLIRPLTSPLEATTIAASVAAPPLAPWIGAGYAAYSGSKIPGDVHDVIADPSWENIGALAGDTAATAIPTYFSRRQFRSQQGTGRPAPAEVGREPAQPPPASADGSLWRPRSTTEVLDHSFPNARWGPTQAARERNQRRGNISYDELRSQGTGRAGEAGGGGRGGGGNYDDFTIDSPENYIVPRETRSFPKAYERWVGDRAASVQEGSLLRKEFADLDDLGIDAVFSFQEGGMNPRFEAVSKYFDDKFATLKAAGVKLGYRENYLPQVWEDSAEAVQKVSRVIQRQVGLEPQFTFERVIENYRKGIKAGLTPKFKSIGELMGWYEQRANKALADRKMFDFLRGNGFIKPARNAPVGGTWKTVDPDAFPFHTILDAEGEVIKEQVWKAPADIRKILNNYLQERPQYSGQTAFGSSYLGRFREHPLDTLAETASVSKQAVLSSGVPFTGINAHGISIMMRAAMSPHGRGRMTGKYLFRPSTAQAYLDEVDTQIPDAIRHGLKMTTEEQAFGQIHSGTLEGTMAGKLLSWQEKVFGNPLFQKILPATKMQHYNSLVGDLSKTMAPEAAKRKAAEITNNIYGGINWEQVVKVGKDGQFRSRSRELQTLARAAVLAPDWLETNWNLMWNVPPAAIRTIAAKIKNNPNSVEAQEYAGHMSRLIGVYMTATTTQKVITGKWMHENPPGARFNVRVGKTADGKDRYIPIGMGTSVDWARLPMEALANLVIDQDAFSALQTARYRTSIPLETGISLLSDTDYAGRPIYGRGRNLSVPQQFGGVAGQLSKLFTPQFVQGGIDLATRRSGFEEALAQGFEFPLRYRRPSRVRRSVLPRLPNLPRRRGRR